MIRTPENIALLYRALWRRLGSATRDEIVPFLERMRLFGANGDRGIRNLERHFDRLRKGQDFIADTLGSPASVRVLDLEGVELRFCDDDFASRTFFDSLMRDGRVHELGVVRLMLATLREDDIFIDVGAHTGYLSCLAGAKGAIVLALELQQSIVPIIRRNAMINGLDRVHVITAAAGARDGLTSVLRYQPTLSGRAFGEGESQTSAKLGSRMLDWLPVIRLDTLAADLPRPPRLVKIDGEGSELQILAGARGLIDRGETAFVLEFHVSLVKEFGGRREDLYDFFPPARWAAFQIEDRGLRPLDQARLHALLDPVSHDGENPSLLFRPIARPTDGNA